VERTLTISDAGLTCQAASQHYRQTRSTLTLSLHPSLCVFAAQKHGFQCYLSITYFSFVLSAE